MALSIRPFRPGDADRVRELHRIALQDAGTNPVDIPERSDLDDVAGHYRPAGEFLVGEANGRIVAIGGVELADDVTAELKRMGVDPDHQRRGFGRAILLALEDEARERDRDRMIVTTATRQDSVPFYRAHGYEETGCECWKGYELIHLVKPLSRESDGLEDSN